MGWSREKGNRTPLLGGWGFSGIWFWDAAGRVMGVRRYLPTLPPKDTTFWISSDPIWCKKWRILAHVFKILA